MSNNEMQRVMKWLEAYFIANRELLPEEELKQLIADMSDLVTAYSLDTSICFVYKGMRITNPYLDETGRFTVNPVEYYGKAYTQSPFIKAIED